MLEFLFLIILTIIKISERVFSQNLASIFKRPAKQNKRVKVIIYEQEICGSVFGLWHDDYW